MPFRKPITTISIGAVLLFFKVGFGQGVNIYTFSGDFDLGFGGIGISSGGHYIAARGDTVYVVHTDGRVWFRKSTDGGVSFGPPVQVNSTPSGVNPSMRVDSAGIIYVAYQRLTDDIYFTKSTDGGASFTPAVKVNDDTDPNVVQENPSIAVNNKRQIFIAWLDQRGIPPGDPSARNLFFASSFDSGSVFNTNIQVNDLTARVNQTVDIAADDSNRIYVVWGSFQPPNKGPIYLVRSTDSGLTFPFRSVVTDLPADMSIAGGFSPSMAINEGLVGVTWQDRRFEQYTLRFSTSHDYGQTFSPSIRVNDSDNFPQEPSLFFKNGIFYVAWRDYRIRPTDSAPIDYIFFSYSANGGVSFAPGTPATFCADTVCPNRITPSVAVNDGGKTVLAWVDDRFDPQHGSMLHTFVTVGTPDFLKGDLNLDGLLTASDAVLELNAVFLGMPFVAPFGSADSNCDSQLTSSDVVLHLNAIFLGEPFPC